MAKLGIVKKVAAKAAPEPKTKKKVTPPEAPVAETPVAETPAPEVKAKAPKAAKEPKAPKEPKGRGPSKFVSVDVVGFTLPNGDKWNDRLRVSEYQDYTFHVNAEKARRLTDEALAADWRKQFPSAVEFNVFHVRGARRDYNAGKHSKMFAGVKTGEATSVEYGADKAPVTGRAKAAPIADKASA
jgi:hypothetical protein